MQIKKGSVRTMPGVIKGLESMGRIVIPRNMLAAAGIEPGELVEIWTGWNDEGLPCVMIKKHVPEGTCFFCGKNDSEIVEFKGVRICKDCIDKICQENLGNVKN